MVDKITLISTGKNNTSDEYNYKIDMEVQKILKNSLDGCKKLLWEHKE